ncbi:AAA family ATPase [Oscillatoria sp. FACHB-1406]|uniref:AAA family ATPase n=1 Tax=Oscillatoria sp. FACHB-1406 TaxID=2692846 RepID=UPI00168279CE|nr:AAA family ATPase [Oscillatoria sp. FACHB-1406]MBD2578299.1 AAA family ATPase [Oscillatoria sp. FACHB-1406]
MLGHLLIGPPGSGKSTFARSLAKTLPNTTIIATDAIRAQLYGDETIQGEWQEIEAEMRRQIQTAIDTGKTPIYDATNYKRSHRFTWLQHPEIAAVDWLAWFLKTPLKICQEWNQKRSRIVPAEVLEAMNRALKQFPPVAAEGFAAVYDCTPHKTPLTSKAIRDKIAALPRSQINSRNRTRNYTFHPYSRLLDFERLMHLISLLLQHPGLGSPTDDLIETAEAVAAAMSRQWGSVYSNVAALAQDLEWLTLNGLIGYEAEATELHFLETMPQPEWGTFSVHAYSDIEPFTRLIKTLRFVLRHPFEGGGSEGVQKALIASMQSRGLVQYDCVDSVRKDIEKVLKPYGILEAVPYKQGYFAGTAIFTASELRETFRWLQSYALQSRDRALIELYQTWQQRLSWGKWLDFQPIYPTRAISLHAIAKIEDLPQFSLARQPERVEEAILAGECWEFHRFQGVGGYATDSEECFCAYPLQLRFHNIAWYLGYEEVGGLLRFERLERLFLGRQVVENRRSREVQVRSLRRLIKLYDASVGLFLGNSAALQQQFLAAEEGARVTVELWASDKSFCFIAEGTQRFGRVPLKMSRPPWKSKEVVDAKLFGLSNTEDERYPRRLCLTVPIWSLDDVDLWRWILGFGGEVKVVQPSVLVTKIKQKAEVIFNS